jgi:hypothetical protein
MSPGLKSEDHERIEWTKTHRAREVLDRHLDVAEMDPNPAAAVPVATRFGFSAIARSIRAAFREPADHSWQRGGDG